MDVARVNISCCLLLFTLLGTALGVPSGLRLVVDTDTGADDAAALLLILGHERLYGGPRLDAITTVQGNTDLDTVIINTFKTLDTAGRLDIPVYRGAEEALVISSPSDNFFGKDGLGDFQYERPVDPRKYVKKGHAVNALIDMVSANPGKVTVLALGPLTNIALAIRLDPTFLSKLGRLIVLGGSVEGVGNVLPGVEFNFYSDPEAAFVVFNSTNQDKNMKPIVLIPWESVSERNIIPMDWRVKVLGPTPSRAVKFLNLAERKVLKTSSNWSSPDTLAAAVVVQPSLVTSSRAEYLQVNPLSRGAAFVDYQDSLKKKKNVLIVKEVNVGNYTKLLMETLS